jgi:hypothetical protein
MPGGGIWVLHGWTRSRGHRSAAIGKRVLRGFLGEVKIAEEAN